VSVGGNLSTNSFNPQTIQTGSLSTTGDLSVGGDLSVTGNTSLTGPLTFPPPSVVGGPLTGTYITGGSINSPSLTITNGSTIFAGIDSTGQLGATNIVSAGSIATLNALIKQNGDIATSGDIVTSGDLGVSGAGKIELDLQVGGDISTIGKITCIDVSSTGNIGCVDLTTSGNIVSAGSVSTNGNITADTATISGDSTLGNVPIPFWDALTSYAQGYQVVDISNNNVYSALIPIFANPSNPPPHLAPSAWLLIGPYVISTVTITEACVVGGSLSVTSDTSSSTVTIAAHLINNGTSDLVGDTTIGVVGGPIANLRVTNDLQVDGTLTATTQVFTNATVNGDLTVTGNASFGTAIPSGQRWEEYLGYSIGETAQYFTGGNGVYYTALQDIAALAVNWRAGYNYAVGTVVAYTNDDPYTYWIATQDVPSSSTTPPASDPDYWAPDIVTPNPAPPSVPDYWKVSANSFLLDGNCTITGDLTTGTFNPPSLTTGFIVLDSTTNAVTAAQGTITSHDLVVTKQSTLSDVSCDTLSITNTLSWVVPTTIPSFVTDNRHTDGLPDIVGAFAGTCGFFDIQTDGLSTTYAFITPPAGYKCIENQTMCFLQVCGQLESYVDIGCVNFLARCRTGPYNTDYPALDNGWVYLLLNQFDSTRTFRFQYFFINLVPL
jgi:hypothetical protein